MDMTLKQTHTTRTNTSVSYKHRNVAGIGSAQQLSDVINIRRPRTDVSSFYQPAFLIGKEAEASANIITCLRFMYPYQI
jgi:hypothetical protein